MDEIDITSGLMNNPLEGDLLQTPQSPSRRMNMAWSETPQNSIMENIAVYRELRTLVNGVGVIASQRAMQRRIRKVIS